MPKDDFIRVRHMLQSCQNLISYTQNKTRADLDKDPLLELALVRLIEIIGEAASHISSEFQSQFPAIPWINIIGMRNRLIHAYYDIDNDRVWDTITDDIPPLITELQKILQSEEKK